MRFRNIQKRGVHNQPAMGIPSRRIREEAPHVESQRVVGVAPTSERDHYFNRPARHIAGHSSASFIDAGDERASFRLAELTPRFPFSQPCCATRRTVGLTIRRLHPTQIQTAPLGPTLRNVEHCQDAQGGDHQDRPTRIPSESRTNPEGSFAAATGDRFLESSTQATGAQRLCFRTRSAKNSRAAACRGIDQAGPVHAEGTRIDATAAGTLGRRTCEAAVGERSNDLQLGTRSEQTAT